ncbi:MAG TPA: hypothetical protein VGX76_22320 [Pirellulales bacterium]|nr:hypothetical protein [Pirellulales bacterium]
MPPTLLSRTQVKAFSDQVQVGAEQAYNSLVNELGVGMSQNPLVAAQLSAIKQKLDNGQAVSQDDINNLKAATKASGLPTSASNNVLQQTGGQLVGLSQANAMLQQSNANGPGSANPSGQMSVMTIPSLAAGIQMLLPNGGLVLGTGGKGEFGVVSANAADLFDEPQGVAEMPADYAPAVASRPTPTNLQATAAPSDDGLAESQSSSTDYDHVIAPMGNQTFAFTIDNGDNNEVFYYTVDAEQQEVPARVRQVHTSHHPLLVRFDRGDGSTAEMRIQTKGEILKVAVDRTDGLWNLDTASTFTPSVVAKSSSDTSAETATANQPAKAPSSIQVSKIGEFLAKLNAADRE